MHSRWCAEEASELEIRQARHLTSPVLSAIAGASDVIERTHSTKVMADCGVMAALDERSGAMQVVCRQQFICRKPV